MSRDLRIEFDARIRRHIFALAAFSRARKVGAYLAFDGEPSLVQVIAAARQRGKQVYVPIIRGDWMGFSSTSEDLGRRLNDFGIAEPARPRFVNVRSLDLVLTPLVSFDDRGARLGVGRSYYDRCFSHLRLRTRWLKPKLLGVAYDLQRAPDLEPREWDVPLWGVVTERGIQTFERTPA